MLTAIGYGPDGPQTLLGRTTSELEATAERADCRWYRQQFLGGETLIRLAREWVALPPRSNPPAQKRRRLGRPLVQPDLFREAA
jgi:hypothetical protein